MTEKIPISAVLATCVASNPRSNAKLPVATQWYNYLSNFPTLFKVLELCVVPFAKGPQVMYPINVQDIDGVIPPEAELYYAIQHTFANDPATTWPFPKLSVVAYNDMLVDIYGLQSATVQIVNDMGYEWKPLDIAVVVNQIPVILANAWEAAKSGKPTT